MPLPSLIYVADPMCSWCWGFSCSIDALRKHLVDEVSIQMVMGGLRAGNTQIMDEKLRDYVLSHWVNVHKASGQPFNFVFNMPQGFIYDTEPACRAIKTADNMAPSLSSDMAFCLMEHIQREFYEFNKDVTNTDVLQKAAQDCGLDGATFLNLFLSNSIKQTCKADFLRARELTVTGFPTLIGEYSGQFTTLAPGYMSAKQLIEVVDNWLNKIKQKPA
ncbi:MAG: DsbA family protein [Magnetococcales bacterium]|nr:DsbA family protein [Magnetococcales bacterium]